MIERLVELAQLPAGWADGDGVPVPVDRVAAVAEVLVRVGVAGASLPSVSATSAGGARCSWLLPDGREVVWRLDARGHEVVEHWSVGSEPRLVLSGGGWTGRELAVALGGLLRGS